MSWDATVDMTRCVHFSKVSSTVIDEAFEKFHDFWEMMWNNCVFDETFEKLTAQDSTAYISRKLALQSLMRLLRRLMRLLRNKIQQLCIWWEFWQIYYTRLDCVHRKSALQSMMRLLRNWMRLLRNVLHKTRLQDSTAGRNSKNKTSLCRIFNVLCRITGCNNGGGGGIFSKVKRLIRK